MRLTSASWLPWQLRLERLIRTVKRYPGLLAGIGFCSGLASFFLVKRQEGLAQIIAIVLLLSWLWLLAEGLLRRYIQQRYNLSIPPTVVRYLTQLVHQESLFFILPFFLLTTHWLSGQFFFTALLVIAALVSIIDPLYYRVLATRRWLYLSYHCLALFAALLCALPILLQLTTAQSYQIALLCTVALSIPSLASVLGLRTWRRCLSVLLVSAVIGLGAWWGRFWVPPATLWLKDISVSTSLDKKKRSPSAPIQEISKQALNTQGLYAYTAIKAPRGLHEQIYHVWQHNGRVVERIALTIRGGREEGYRAWTHKLNFPKKPVGAWQVAVVTESGQRLGSVQFTVTP